MRRLALSRAVFYDDQFAQSYNKELKTLLDSRRDDASPVAEIGERRPGDGDKDGGKRKRLPLEEITRFTMVKRIW